MLDDILNVIKPSMDIHKSEVEDNNAIEEIEE